MNDKMDGNSQSKTLTFSHDQLLKAMRDGLDLMERCQIFGFLLGDAARSAWDGVDLNCKEIQFGIKGGEYTRLTKEIIGSTRHDVTMGENEASYLVDGVPVVIKVINRKYGFLKHLDHKDYNYDQYLFPNPFEKYFKARFIIQ